MRTSGFERSTLGRPPSRSRSTSTMASLVFWATKSEWVNPSLWPLTSMAKVVRRFR